MLSILLFGSGIFIFSSCNACDFSFINTSKNSDAGIFNEKDLEEFNSVKISFSTININFIASDSYGLEIFTYEECASLTWSIKNKELTIEEKHSLFSDFFYIVGGLLGKSY